MKYQVDNSISEKIFKQWNEILKLIDSSPTTMTLLLRESGKVKFIVDK